jgi:hypothetical protein
VDDLDDLLAGRDRAKHMLADRLLGRPVDELADHRQCDVGLEQGDPDLAHRRADIRLGQSAAAAKTVEDCAEAVAQTVEHALPSSARAQNAKNAGGRNLAGQRAPLRGALLSQRDVGRIAARGRNGKTRS